MILRWKISKGLKVNYVPGWYCHGLPIELKALKDTKVKVNERTIGYTEGNAKI